MPLESFSRHTKACSLPAAIQSIAYAVSGSFHADEREMCILYIGYAGIFPSYNRYVFPWQCGFLFHKSAWAHSLPALFLTLPASNRKLFPSYERARFPAPEIDGHSD